MRATGCNAARLALQTARETDNSQTGGKLSAESFPPEVFLLETATDTVGWQQALRWNIQVASLLITVAGLLSFTEPFS